MKKQQGFTLIELMIVVAVIGVLSAIAIPQYQKYVAKAEGAAALATLTSLKTNVEAFTVENGYFPPNEQADIVGSPSSALGTISYDGDKNKTDGTIQFAFNEKSSPLNQEQMIVLNRESDGTWSCIGTSKDQNILPKGCSSRTNQPFTNK